MELGHGDGVPQWQDWTGESQSCLRSGRRHDTTHRRTHSQAQHVFANRETLEKLNDPHFSIMSPTTVRGACCCSIMMIKRVTAPSLSLFFYQQSCLPNDKRLFMILLPSSYTYCLTYVVPYISLTPPWTQHIHLMQWINGSELVSAPGPLGTRLGAERTLIPIHPRQIHFLALTQSKARRSDRFESR